MSELKISGLRDYATAIFREFFDGLLFPSTL